MIHRFYIAIQFKSKLIEFQKNSPNSPKLRKSPNSIGSIVTPVK